MTGLVLALSASVAAADTDGAMAVDCNATMDGIQDGSTQSNCSYNSGSNFEIKVTNLLPGGAPSTTYSGFQLKLAWDDPILQFQAPADPGTLDIWPNCSIAALSDNQALDPSEPSFAFTCVSFPPVNSTRTGDLAKFEFQCQGEGVTPLTLVPRPGDPQQGTHFIDPATNPVDPALANASVRCVDTTPPETFLDSGPPDPTNDNTSTFDFHSDDGAATFECRLYLLSAPTPPAFGPCLDDPRPGASHTPAAPLADNRYKFEVRARDLSNNVDVAPASQTFTVDTAPPAVTINSFPPSLTNDNTPQFGFSSEPGASFQCRVDGVDGDPFGACSGPGASHTTATLLDGPHTFHVRATDAAGNTSAPAIRNFTVDATPPDTTIDSGPEDPTPVEDATPQFGFSSEPGVQFRCSVDAAPFAFCPNPYTTSELPNGPHTLDVRAVDAAGNQDPTPASRSFTVAVQGVTIAPNTTDDELNGDGDCSLREAITAANTDATVDACPAGSGPDTIPLAADTYPLAIAGAGEDDNATGDLDITAQLTIKGAGADQTAVDGGDLDRVFHVIGTTAELSGLAVRNGTATGSGGGGIRSGSTLTLKNATVSGNVASGGGGGISSAGSLTLERSTVSANSGSFGGGISSDGSLALENSTISGNTATGFPGGGIYVVDGTASLESSTIAANSAVLAGGGIYDPLFDGVALRNTLLADNSPSDCWATIDSAGHNLIESTSFCTIVGDATGNLTGVDPALTALADNGGPTQTHDLTPGSPAIDAGSDDCPPPAGDQRGVPRPQAAGCDIGAVETCDDLTDHDGDGLTDCDEVLVHGTDPFDADMDNDTCPDGPELNGGHDPTNPWDLMDVPTGEPPARDGQVSGGDIAAIVARFGSSDAGPGTFDRNSDPLSTPNSVLVPSGLRENYHPAYDRGGSAPGNPLALLPPNGFVSGGDIAAVVAQFGFSCTL